MRFTHGTFPSAWKCDFPLNTIPDASLMPASICTEAPTQSPTHSPTQLPTTSPTPAGAVTVVLSVPEWSEKLAAAYKTSLAIMYNVEESMITLAVNRRLVEGAEGVKLTVTIEVPDIATIEEITQRTADDEVFTQELVAELKKQDIVVEPEALVVAEVESKVDAPGATQFPSKAPTTYPTAQPTETPTHQPTNEPTTQPTATPTSAPTPAPCVLVAKNGCSSMDMPAVEWDKTEIDGEDVYAKETAAQTQESCQEDLKTWSSKCRHRILGTFEKSRIFAQMNEDFTSTCSHIHCITKSVGDARGKVTRVHHHRMEQYGSTHVCKYQMHVKGKCGCECFDETAGEGDLVNILGEEAFGLVNNWPKDV